METTNLGQTNFLKLRRLFVDIFLITPEEFSTVLAMRDLAAWDSLGALVLIEEIQNEFSCTFSDNELSRINDVSSIIKLLEQKGHDFDQ